MKSWNRRVSAMLVAAIFLALVCCSARVQAQNQADMILHNGKILTVDKDFSTAEAVAITGNQISAVGTNETVLNLAGPKTLKLDLKGRTVIPGMIDTHKPIQIHSEWGYGGVEWVDADKFNPANASKLQRYPIDWRGVTSKEDVLGQVKMWMQREKFKPGEWIYFTTDVAFNKGAAGLSRDALSKIMYEGLTRWELDKVTPNNPIIMTEGIPEENGLLVNSKAIEIMWAKWGDFIKRNGHYWMDAKGQPDGHLESPASRLALEFLKNRPAEFLAPLYRKGMEEKVAQGVTSIATKMYQENVDGYKLLESQGQLIHRIAYGRQDDFGLMTDLRSGMKKLKSEYLKGSDKLWLISFTPVTVDGSGSRACMGVKKIGEVSVLDLWWPQGQCYLDSEYNGAAGKGARISENYYKNWVLETAANGLRFTDIHVAGDRSVRMMLNLMEEAQQRYGRDSTKGWTMDHCTFIDPADFARAAKIGAVFSCAPRYIENLAPAAAKSFGEKVANTFVTPIGGLIKSGNKVVFEEARDVYLWHDIRLMITRKDQNGKIWGAQDAVDRPTALKLATRWAAEYYLMKGDKLGSIEPGKFADMVVLDQDYLTIPVEQIEKITPQMTIFDGKIVFLHPTFSQEQNLQPESAIVTTYQDIMKSRTYNGPTME